MIAGLAFFVAALFVLVSAWGFFFAITSGPSHGPGVEVGIVAGILALIAGAAAIRLRPRDPE